VCERRCSPEQGQDGRRRIFRVKQIRSKIITTNTKTLKRSGVFTVLVSAIQTTSHDPDYLPWSRLPPMIQPTGQQRPEPGYQPAFIEWLITWFWSAVWSPALLPLPAATPYFQTGLPAVLSFMWFYSFHPTLGGFSTHHIELLRISFLTATGGLLASIRITMNGSLCCAARNVCRGFFLLYLYRRRGKDLCCFNRLQRANWEVNSQRGDEQGEGHLLLSDWNTAQTWTESVAALGFILRLIVLIHVQRSKRGFVGRTMNKRWTNK